MEAEQTRRHIRNTDNWLGYITDDCIWDELNELERLARIGMATEKAIQNGYDIWCDCRYKTKVGHVDGIEGINGLLKWAEVEV